MNFLWTYTKREEKCLIIEVIKGCEIILYLTPFNYYDLDRVDKKLTLKIIYIGYNASKCAEECQQIEKTSPLNKICKEKNGLIHCCVL